MGSRCNIYLYRDNINECYAVTRKGYIIKKIQNDIMLTLYEKLNSKFKNFMNEYKIKMMIIDGELIPWKSLGNELIDKLYKNIDYSLNQELNLLKKFGFDETYNELMKKYDDSN